LNDGANDININWEHTEYRFIRPDELRKYDTVPHLQLSLSRVLLGTETESGLKALKGDHHSGAGILALIALETLQKIAQGEDLQSATTTEEFWRDFRMAAWHLSKNGRPAMSAAIEAAIFRVLNTASAALDRSAAHGGLELSTFKSIIGKSIEARIAARGDSLDALGKSFEQYLVDGQGRQEKDRPSCTTIVTLSSSSTIGKCLTHLIRRSPTNEMDIKLCILESRPLFEGVSFATTLLDSLEGAQSETRTLPEFASRLQVEIFSDASVAIALKTANYVVIGADKVWPNGDVSNKIGSLTVAALAKTLQPECKVVAVFETDKIIGEGNEDERLKVEYNDQTEVTRAWPSNYTLALQEKQATGYQVSVKNVYFEWVPAAYIDRYISDEGSLTAQDITRLSKEQAELEDKLFRDL
jgi:translation initiation factor 2B subunit (eIF-2B alpha/beta/delta family)